MPRRSGPFRAVRVRFRRALRRLDRRTPEWLRWLAPWWTSITIHALALLVLAVVVITHDAVRNSDRSFDAAFADQLRDDLTSLAPGERSGDPFTTLNSDVPPSLSLDPDDRNATAINVPELPPDVVLGPRLQRRKPTRGFNSVAAASATNGPPARLEMGENRMAPFSGRQGEMRARLVRREGGTVESEKAVERGLDWIARHQLPDGSWGLDPRPACKGNGCPPRGGMICDSAATGLALLPLLGAGHTHTDKGRYQATLRRGLEYLVNIQLSDGEDGQGPDNTRLYAHAIATMALCEAYGLTKD